MYMIRVASILLLVFLLLPLPAAAEQNQAPIKVAIIGPLSGDTVSFGESVKNGAIMAYDELPEDQRRTIALIFEDDGFQPARTVSAFRKAVDMDKASVVLVSGSSCGLAVSPLAEELKIPVVAVASDGNVVKGRNFVVNLWVTPETEAEAAYAELMRRKYRTIARISTEHAFPETVNKAFDKRAGKDIELALDQSFTTDVRDFRPIITRLRALPKLDAVELVLLPGQLGIFARQLREQGITVPMFGYEFFEDPREVEASRGALVGQWYVNSKSAQPDFLKAYERKFPEAPSFAAANGYDFVKIIALALSKDRSTQGINHTLHKLDDFQGALGRYSASGQNTFTLPAAIKVVTESGFKELY